METNFFFLFLSIQTRQNFRTDDEGVGDFISDYLKLFLTFHLNSSNHYLCLKQELLSPKCLQASLFNYTQVGRAPCEASEAANGWLRQA